MPSLRTSEGRVGIAPEERFPTMLVNEPVAPYRFLKASTYPTLGGFTHDAGPLTLRECEGRSKEGFRYFWRRDGGQIA